MITFYPTNTERWSADFDFNPPITLTPREKNNYKVFYNREEFLAFLKDRGVRFDDPNFPVKIELCTESHPTLGVGVYEVTQRTLQGWIKDSLT